MRREGLTMPARLTLGIVVAVSIVATSAGAAVFDHLKCYKVKGGSSVTAVVDLQPAAPELPLGPGCKVKGPTLFCAPVSKTVVTATPPPPGAPPGSDETPHLCYKLKCPKPLPDPLVATDQFGTFDLRPTRTSIVCTPAVLGTTTTVTNTTSTTTGGSCRTCWISVSDLCTAQPCTSDLDCQTGPNLFCMPDKCPVPCP
jgi:hypothetical protein